MSKTIRLCKTKLAGTFAENRRENLAHLVDNTSLVLVREPENPYDCNAIAVKDAAGGMLGYIPAVQAEILAVLADRGFVLRAYLLTPLSEMVVVGVAAPFGQGDFDAA